MSLSADTVVKEEEGRQEGREETLHPIAAPKAEKGKASVKAEHQIGNCNTTARADFKITRG